MLSIAPRSVTRLTLLGGLVLCMGLAGCASVRDSRANPFNWFGGATEVARADDIAVASEETEVPEINPLIPRQRESIFRNDEEEVYAGTLVAEITDLAVDRVPGGAVIRAVGTATSLGAFDARLVAVETEEDDRLRFEMRALQPSDTRGQGTDAARRIFLAINLTDQALARIHRIEVVAAENEVSVRR